MRTPENFQLLVEMDGIASKEGVIMLASTNRGDVLDKVNLNKTSQIPADVLLSNL
jgi:ATP-dependent Zn protease